MSTEISQAYDALVARMAALFPQHIRLSNSVDLTQNNEQFLKQGWGLLFGPAENTERFISKQLSVSRSVSIHLTRRVVARELDATTKADIDKLLLEDLQKVIDDLEQNFTLETGKFVVKYLNDTGLFYVHGEKELYLAVTATASIEYFRNL